MRAALRNLLWVLLTAAYPLLVYFGLTRAEPRVIALLLCALALARWLGSRSHQALAVALTGLGLAAIATWTNAALPLKLYPVAVNGALLAFFALSLWQGPPVVERLARLQEPELDARAIAYTRRVTQVWCAFFLLNGSVALATALWASDATWALYNGLIAYGLMGALMGVEWLVRQRVRARPWVDA
jgi:uncharacterized membrane protein